MLIEDTADSISRTQRARLMLRDARARLLSLITLVVTGFVLAVSTLGAVAAPADAQVIVENQDGAVVAAYDPSMAERAVFGLQEMTGQAESVQTPATSTPPCDPTTDPDCEETPPPDSLCTQIAQWGPSDKGMLPVHRWTDATSNLHTRLGAKFTDDMYEKLARNGMAQGALSVGNAAWSTSVTVTEAANQFCVGDSIGTTVDKAMGSVARSIFFDAWFGPVILVFLTIGIIYRSARSGSFNMGQMGRLLGVTGLVVVMMNGAANSGNGSYGTMSPGWMMDKANSVLATTSGALSSSLLSSMDDLGGGGTTPVPVQYAEKYPSHCYNYMDQLVGHYKNKYIMADVMGMTAAPLSLNAVWTESALQSYIGTQFGSGNAYGQAAFCHQLEINAQVSPVEHAWYTLRTLDGEKDYPNEEKWANQILNLALNGEGGQAIYSPRDNLEEDQAMAFWASCASTGGDNWVTAPGWEEVRDGEIEDSVCEAAYEDNDYDWGGSPFNWKNRDHILENTSPMAAHPGAFSDTGNAFHPRQFLENYQGWAAGDGMIAAILHAVVGIILLILFGAISLFILIAKMALVVLTATVVLVGLADMAFGRTSSRLVKFFKLLLGMAIITWGASFFMALLAVLTRIINAMGKAMDLNVVGAIIWAGVAPVLAVLLFKFVFSKVLKMPDPLSVQGAKNYMSSAGVIGGSAMDRATAAPAAAARSGWNRLTGGGKDPALAGAGAGGHGGVMERGSGGGHSAGRGRLGGMQPEIDPASEIAQRSPAGSPPAGSKGAGSPGSSAADRKGAAADAGSKADGKLKDATSQKPESGQAAADEGEGKRKKVRYGKAGAGLPGEVAGAWGRHGAGRDVQRRSQVKAGKDIERAAIGGLDEVSGDAIGRWKNRNLNAHAVRRVEKQMNRQAIAARRSEMGRVRRNVDRVSSGAGKVLRGFTSARASAATLGVAAGAAVAGAAFAPALMVAGAGMGAIALARHRNARKNGVYAARRAARNQRALQVFMEERRAQMERESQDDVDKENPSKDQGEGGKNQDHGQDQGEGQGTESGGQGSTGQGDTSDQGGSDGPASSSAKDHAQSAPRKDRMHETAAEGDKASGSGSEQQGGDAADAPGPEGQQGSTQAPTSDPTDRADAMREEAQPEAPLGHPDPQPSPEAETQASTPGSGVPESAPEDTEAGGSTGMPNQPWNSDMTGPEPEPARARRTAREPERATAGGHSDSEQQDAAPPTADPQRSSTTPVPEPGQTRQPDMVEERNDHPGRPGQTNEDGAT